MISADGTNPYTRQDLEDLRRRWARAHNAGEFQAALDALHAIEEYVQDGAVPVDDGPDRVLVRLTKRGPL